MGEYTPQEQPLPLAVLNSPVNNVLGLHVYLEPPFPLKHISLHSGFPWPHKALASFAARPFMCHQLPYSVIQRSSSQTYNHRLTSSNITHCVKCSENCLDFYSMKADE